MTARNYLLSATEKEEDSDGNWGNSLDKTIVQHVLLFIVKIKV